MLRMVMRRSALKRAARPRDVKWEAIVGKLSTEEGKNKYNQLRQLTAEVERFIESCPKEVSTPNFDSWRSVIATPGVVDQAEKLYNAIEIPYPEDTSVDADVNDFTDALALCDEVVDTAKADIAKLEVDLKSILAQKANLPTLTHEDILNENPEWRDELLEEIVEKDKWF